MTENRPFGKFSAAKIQEIIGNAILETTKRHTMLLLRLLLANGKIHLLEALCDLTISRC